MGWMSNFGSSQLMVVFSIEAILIALTIVLLSRPRLVFDDGSVRLKRWAGWGGMLFLCLTFCWSFVLGALLVMQELYLSSDF